MRSRQPPTRSSKCPPKASTRSMMRTMRGGLDLAAKASLRRALRRGFSQISATALTAVSLGNVPQATARTHLDRALERRNRVRGIVCALAHLSARRQVRNDLHTEHEVREQRQANRNRYTHLALLKQIHPGLLIRCHIDDRPMVLHRRRLRGGWRWGAMLKRLA